jgi:hypothetical protein
VELSLDIQREPRETLQSAIRDEKSMIISRAVLYNVTANRSVSPIPSAAIDSINTATKYAFLSSDCSDTSAKQ